MESWEQGLEDAAYDAVINSHFSRQFQRTERFIFQDSELRVWDMQLKDGKEQVNDDSVPLLYIPGWASTPHPYRDGLKVHYESGRRIISIAFSPKAKEVLTDGVPLALATKVQAVMMVLDHKKIGKVDVIGYSEGSIIALYIAERNRERFRHIVLHGVPGLTGKITYFNILWIELLNFIQILYFRFFVATPEQAAIMQTKIGDVLNWMKQVGFAKSIMDGMGSIRIEPLKYIEKLTQSERRRGIGIVAARHDRIVDYKGLHHKARELNLHFGEVVGGHHVFEAKAVECARITEGMLNDFESQSYVRV